MTVETRTMPVISSAHLSPTTLDYMGSRHHSKWPMGGGVFDYGFLLYAHEEAPENTPADLLPIYEWAVSHGWTYILIDRDADTVADLPQYNHDQTGMGN